MGSLNKCHFIGNLGKDPEIKQVGNSKVANFSLALTEKFKDQQGQSKEKTEWIDIVAWNKTADVVEQWLHKGKQIYVEASVETKSWETEGQKRYKTQFKAKAILMLGKKENGQQVAQNDYAYGFDGPPPDYNSFP